MKKTLFFLSLVFVFLFSNAQKQETVMFAYSSSESDFLELVDYCEVLNVNVIDYCETEKLIFVNLNNQFNEYTEFFDELGKIFDGSCTYKSDNNEIFSYLNCQGRDMQEMKLNEETKKIRQ
ncbi:MAG: hypothetical protein JXR53_10350 [Bacteroidales bacterium]|nr:hypothetical protein [Bacteroidales bacterium]